MIPAETTGGKRVTLCLGCRAPLYLRVLESAGGYYIGYRCARCGPQGRESDYYNTRLEAQDAMDKRDFGRETQFNGRHYKHLGNSWE